MIRIERKETPKAKAAKEALLLAKKRKGSYNIEEVNTALHEMFHGKCYICENKEVTSYHIEHLIPHRGNIELKYDWNNLFWACAHCNNIKADRYEPILDCTKVAVDEVIAFRKSGYFGTDECLYFEPLIESEEVRNTILLLKDAYYGTTVQKNWKQNQFEKNCGKNCMILRSMCENIKKQRERIRKIYCV